MLFLHNKGLFQDKNNDNDNEKLFFIFKRRYHSRPNVMEYFCQNR